MRRTLAVTIAIFAIQMCIAAQSATLDSYTKARSVLDRAVTAYGGLGELRAIENVWIKVEGDSVHRNQSKKTFALDRTPLKAEYIIDLKNTRYRQVLDGHYPGGFDWVNGFAINRTEGVQWDQLRGVFTPMANIPASNLRRRIRIVPQLMVLNAFDRASRLRHLGTATLDGRPHSVLSYSNEDGVEYSLYFDDRTGLLTKNEYLFTDSFTGDTLSEMVYTGYRQEGSRMIPTGRRDLLSGELVGDVRYPEFKFNTTLSDDNFKLPANLRQSTPAPPSQPVTKYSDNVYTVNAGGYNVLAVGFKDHVFVMETPANDATSRQAIAEVKKLFPGKPIKYFAVTHHHDDHAGGFRTYVAEGATLLGLPGEKSFFEKIVTSKFTIDPDLLTSNPQPLKWEAIEKGRRVLTDGTTTVELIDIGPGGHTDEMLVAFLPNEKLVFQGDLLNRPNNNDPATINATTVHFANWLERSKLGVDRVIGVHGPPSTMDELRQGVAKFKPGN